MAWGRGYVIQYWIQNGLAIETQYQKYNNYSHPNFCAMLLVALQVKDTVNREYFDVKIVSDSMACAKIKHTKYMRDINDNAVQGRLSENYLT